MTVKFLKRFVCVDLILLLIVWSSQVSIARKVIRQNVDKLTMIYLSAWRSPVEFDATLIQLSTDYIFDGQKDIAYFEDDAPNPLNLFGQTRLEAERDIENLLDQHIILRVSHLFAHGSNSFVTESFGSRAGRVRVANGFKMNVVARHPFMILAELSAL